jgi:hypothetical protein
MEEIPSYADLYPDFEVVDNTEKQPEVVVDTPVEEATVKEEISLSDLYGEEIEEKETVTETPDVIKKEKKQAVPKEEFVTRLDGAIAGAKVIAKGFGLSEEVLTQLEQITDEADLVSFYEDLADGYKQHIIEDLKEDPITDALLEFKENGGNPLQLLDLFKEQQDVLSLDLSVPKNQISLIREKYKTDGLSPEKIEKKIERLSALGEDALLEEAEDSKTFFEEKYSQERESLLEQQKQRAERIKQIEYQRVTQFEAKAKELKLKGSELDILKANAFQKVKLKDTQEIIPLWQAKAMQLQADPENAIELMMFLENPKKYKEALVKQGVTSNTVNVFKKALDIKPKPDSVLESKVDNKIKIKFDK